MTKVRRYRLSYWGTFIGSYDTAKKALEAYRKYEEIRPIIDRRGEDVSAYATRTRRLRQPT
jgi:hypothetical protein